MNKKLERACAKYDKDGKIIKHAVAKINWTHKQMTKLGLDPDNGEDREFLKEINE